MLSCVWRRRWITLVLFALCAAPLPGEEPVLLLKSFPPEASLSRDGTFLTPQEQILREDGSLWRRYALSRGYQVLTLSAPGYRSKRFHLTVQGTVEIDEKLERHEGSLRLLGEFPTGRQPKGVAFAPDGESFVVTNLDGPGIDLYSTEPLSYLRRLVVPGEERGFVEALYLPRRGELLVSQMTTGEMHLFDLPEYGYLGSLPSGGTWPKVMASDPLERRLYVSNWIDRSIGVIDLEGRELIDRIEVPGIPRGMALTGDGRRLYVALFDRGDLAEVSLGERGNSVELIEIGDGALRHLALSPDGRRLYISDMYHGRVLMYDTLERQVVAEARLGRNLNTLALTPDGRYLLVSERGANSPEGYTRVGPDFGRVFLCNAETLEVVGWIWGRNQPTGLAVSPDGGLVAFTDFLDDNLELYELTPRE